MLDLLCPRELIATMTDLNVNEQDVDDDADVVDSWMLYLRARAHFDARNCCNRSCKPIQVHYRSRVLRLT